MRHEERVRRLRLDEGYHILGALGLQVGVGIVIESTLGNPAQPEPNREAEDLTKRG